MNTPLLELRDVEVEFRTRDGIARVLDRVGFSLSAGTTLGIVGESGCGKSMTALTIMRLVPQPPAASPAAPSGSTARSCLPRPRRACARSAATEISMVFQEPMTSLNPVFSVGDQIAETVRLHQRLSKREALDRAVEMLAAVGIPVPERRVREYPHQLSGGMRQRVMIAIGLACGPRVLIADEPTTALDVTVQAQIFDLLIDLKERTGTSIILITHDMGAIAKMADRVVVMYAGRIVEEGPSPERLPLTEIAVMYPGQIVEQADRISLFTTPLHPYTWALLSAVPSARPRTDRASRRVRLVGDPPSPIDPPLGCRFAGRCPFAQPQCKREVPRLRTVRQGHRVACHLVGDDGSAPHHARDPQPRRSR